ncbi:MAG: hypothetical protein GX986_08260 [Firmicutes bacterium]|nr:hypothetical protein [Bacillota bacterium]
MGEQYRQDSPQFESIRILAWQNLVADEGTGVMDDSSKDLPWRWRSGLVVLLCFIVVFSPIFSGYVLASDLLEMTDGVQALAQAVVNEHYARLNLEEKSFTDGKLRMLDGDGASLHRAVLEITSAAAVLGGMGVSESVASVFAAMAVVNKPDDALALCNLGAMLHLLGRLYDSVAVLELARSIEPDSPVIITNLANSLYDLGDLEAAKGFYLEAIARDARYAPALRCLGDLYLATGDWHKALEQYLAAAEYGFTPQVRRGIGEATDGITQGGDGETLPIPPGLGAGPDDVELGQTSGVKGGLSIFVVDGSAPPLAQISIPNLPQWSDYIALAKSSQELNELSLEVATSMQDVVTGYHGLALKTTDAGEISYEKQLTQLAYLERYYVQQLNRLKERHGGLFTQITTNVLAPLEEELDGLAETYQEKVLAIAMAGGPEEKIQQELAQALKDWCEAQDALHGRYYGQWVNQAKQYYAELRLLLEMYIQDSAPILTTIYDPASFRMADIDRQLLVLTEVQDMTLSWAAASTSFFRCLYHPCSHGADPVDTDGLTAKANQPPDCPFEGGGKLKIDLGIVALTIDCTTVGIDGGELITGGVDWNFKERRVTALRLGIGASVGGGVYGEQASRDGALGTKTGMGAGGSMGLGLEFTFDEYGGISDMQGRWDMGAHGTTPVGGYGPAVSLMAGTSGASDVSFGW